MATNGSCKYTLPGSISTWRNISSDLSSLFLGALRPELPPGCVVREGVCLLPGGACDPPPEVLGSTVTVISGPSMVSRRRCTVGSRNSVFTFLHCLKDPGNTPYRTEAAIGQLHIHGTVRTGEDTERTWKFHLGIWR